MGKLGDLLRDCDQMVAGAARIGGISYFHEFAYDLLAENERITAAAFDAAIDAFRHGKLKKINVVSSSMVFENSTDLADAGRRATPLRRPARPTGFRSWPPNITPRALGAVPVAVHDHSAV